MDNKLKYYKSFSVNEFLGGKELLKSMPILYNKVYFCSNYIGALNGTSNDDKFSCICLLCDSNDINQLREIIKNNFLYIEAWDSLNCIIEGDYGFSYIVGNIKYIIAPFTQTEKGYNIKLYDVENRVGCNTNIETDKTKFLSVNITAEGDIIRTCNFSTTEIKPDNTSQVRANVILAKDEEEDNMKEYNAGVVAINFYLIMLISSLSIVAIFFSYLLINLK